MTDNLPDYSTFDPPDDTEPADFSTHERRAALLRRIREAGSPFAINQSRVAEQFDVHRSTVSRDMDRLRESIGEHLGDDAKLTTRTLFERTVRELLETDDWRAKKAAWDIVMDWNEWLSDVGEQHREPDRSEVDVRSRNLDVTYELVREGDSDPLPTTDDGEVDHKDLGFTSSPVTVDFDE